MAVGTAFEGSSDKSPGIAQYKLQRLGQVIVVSPKDNGTHPVVSILRYLYPAIFL